jgi:hypothetical protein
MQAFTVDKSNLKRIQFENSDGLTVYGADQEWFSAKLQRMAGCSPLPPP